MRCLHTAMCVLLAGSRELQTAASFGAGRSTKQPIAMPCSSALPASKSLSLCKGGHVMVKDPGLYHDNCNDFYC